MPDVSRVFRDEQHHYENMATSPGRNLNGEIGFKYIMNESNVIDVFEGT